MNDKTSWRPTLEELQSVAPKPLIELMARSLVDGDDAGCVLLEWLETTEGEEAVRVVLPELLAALRRAAAARQLS